MAETRILPVRSINSSACRGTLRLSCVQGGTRLEPMLQCRKAGSVTLYAMLRRGRVTRAEADGAGYFVAANDVAGAIILMDGTIAGAAFYGISAAARERAFTAVRMEEARRQGEQRRQSCRSYRRLSAPPSPQRRRSNISPPQRKTVPKRAMRSREATLAAPCLSGQTAFSPRRTQMRSRSCPAHMCAASSPQPHKSPYRPLNSSPRAATAAAGITGGGRGKRAYAR